MNNKTEIFAKVYYHKLYANKSFYKKNSTKYTRLVNLPKLNKNNNSNGSKLRLNELLSENNFVISGKRCISDEPSYLLNQIQRHNIDIWCIKNIPKINIVDTYEGGIYFEKDKFIFCLIPRKETTLLKDNDLFIKTLKFCEQQTTINKSNRGEKRKVFFETPNTNYINYGLGVCRGKKGIYKREIKNLDDIKRKRFENHLKSIQFIAENIFRN